MSRREHLDVHERREPSSRETSSVRFSLMACVVAVLIAGGIPVVHSLDCDEPAAASPRAIEPVGVADARRKVIAPTRPQPLEPVQEQASHDVPMASLPPRTNMQIAEEIGEVLNARSDEYHISLRYQKGIVVLEGTVCNETERLEIGQLPFAVPEVKSVINELRCDADIHKTLRTHSLISKLLWNAIYSSKFACYHLETTCYQDQVKISGVVSNEAERTELEQICAGIMGVKSVNNQLRCDPMVDMRSAESVKLLRSMVNLR